MPRESKPKQDNPEQSRRFIETARALECDEDEAAFDEKLKRIAQVKPKPKNQAGSGGASGASASPSSGGKPRRARNRPGSE
jgi:hypothetical protein